MFPIRHAPLSCLQFPSSTDLKRLHPTIVLSAMRGVRRCGCYFLWPTTQQDGTADQCGMVEEGSYFRCVRAMEASGLLTAFPHPSQLYRTLLAKEWQASLTLLIFPICQTSYFVYIILFSSQISQPVGSLPVPQEQDRTRHDGEPRRRRRRPFPCGAPRGRGARDHPQSALQQGGGACAHGVHRWGPPKGRRQARL